MEATLTTTPRFAAGVKSLLALIGVVLLAVGLSALALPDRLATLFGIPTDSAASRAYVVAAGTRDIAMGLWLLALLGLGASRRDVAASISAMALVAAADAANVYAHSGTRSGMALLAHLGSFVALASVGAWLWSRRGEITRS